MSEISNLQKITSSISANMVMATSETLDDEIYCALKRILSSLNVDRVGLLQVNPYSSVVNVAYAQYAESIPHVPKQIDLAALFPWAYDQIVNKGKNVIMNSMKDLPPCAKVDRCSHVLLGNKSTLDIPLFVGSRVHHIFSLDLQREERLWPAEVVALTRLMGEIFVSALQRRESELTLRRTMGRLDVAAASADAGLWELNLDTGSLWATIKAREHFGFAPDETLTLSRLLKKIIPDDRELIRTKIEEVRSSQDDTRMEYRIRTKDGSLRWMVSQGRVHWDDIENNAFLFGATSDVTRSKELEIQLQAQILETERLSQQLLRENIYLREAEGVAEQGEILGSSDAMRTVMTQISQVARTGSTVLLQGETGTGKGLVAQTIHRMSDRGKRVMVKVNCAALPSPLVESELFGREKGAYTGALSRQSGRFELADGSTLFLDEIAEMSLETQAKLLRVLQDSEFERLGSSTTTTVDVRIIVASNKDLAKEVDAGRFRSDLYYRLNIFPIHVPPLRERTEDIPQLVWEFIKEFGERMGKQIRRIAQKDMQVLMTYSWPGNIRELRNVIEHSFIISPGEVLVLQRLTSGPDILTGSDSLEDVERRHIQSILSAAKGKIKGPEGAAERLAIHPSTLYSRMRKLGIPFKQQ